jgi:hypothetical protein
MEQYRESYTKLFSFFSNSISHGYTTRDTSHIIVILTSCPEKYQKYYCLLHTMISTNKHIDFFQQIPYIYWQIATIGTAD